MRQYRALRCSLGRAAGIIACAGLLIASVGVGQAATDTVTRASVTKTGGSPNDESWADAVSANARLVVFSTNATNVAGDGKRGVFLRNLTTKTTERISVTATGQPAPGWAGAITPDGRYVVFTSKQALVAADTNGATDVYLRDRVSHTIRRVSVTSTGGQGNGGSMEGAISADGRYVAFASDASNMVAGDTNGQDDVFVRDRQAKTTTRISVATAGTQAEGSSVLPNLSADGRDVTYVSSAANLISRDTNGEYDVFIRDRVRGTTTRVSVSNSGGQLPLQSSGGSVSADGRFVVFSTESANAVAGDTNNASDVFLRDRLNKTTRRVSLSSSEQQASGGWGSGAGPNSISANGRYIAFTSAASDLVPGDENGSEDAFLRDRWAGTTQRVSVTSTGGEIAWGGAVYPAVISADGASVAFTAYGPNVTPDDTTLDYDAFLWHR